MPTLEEIKQHLRIDYDDEDEYLQILQLAANRYIVNAVGKYDDQDPLFKLLALVIIGDMYKNREYTTDRIAKKPTYTIQSIVHQLQLDQYAENEG